MYARGSAEQGAKRRRADHAMISERHDGAEPLMAERGAPSIGRYRSLREPPLSQERAVRQSYQSPPSGGDVRQDRGGRQGSLHLS
ncbi:hypothetical protein MES4922_80009 [Mesorhizobium ventifaucium]|uniref:Uncharacterized protein n=1 Tax=Mesorhizobium ventifaucium TaxID=666020 RepID=A0ABN8KDR8_9HYPH|nr:hypothetical protein MES4922_80009 [Mesorhizobium ventifaucium]